MDIAGAQSLFGGAGTLHRIGVTAAEGADVPALATRIEDRLGGRVDAVTPSERTGQARQLLGAFRLNLTAMSLVSLVVGTFLVFSSMRACLVWQRREFGVLRSLGSTPAQVLALILGEAALLGVVGVVIGILAGYWTAVWNLDAVSSTLTNVYMLREIESLEVSGGTLALAVLAGLGGALSGTLLPALDVWRRDTRTLLDTLPAQSAGTALTRTLFRLGLLLVAGAVGWYWFIGWRWRLTGFVLSTAVLLCLPLVTPWLVQRLTGRVRVPDFGFRYGVRSLGATLANTSFSVSSLAMAVCLLVGITLLVESFRETLVRWVNRSLTADVFVTATVGARPGPEATLSPRLVERLAGRPDVEDVAPLRRLVLRVEGRRLAVVGVDLGRPAARRRLALLSSGDAVGRAVRDRGVLIGEPLSRGASVTVGDTVEIEGPEGPVRLPVSGVYRDYTQGGSVTMDLGLMAETLGSGSLTSVALVLRPGADPEAVAAGIESRYPRDSLRVRSNRRLKEDIFNVFDQTFAVTRILQVMSLIIAACAITLTLLVVAQEKGERDRPVPHAGRVPPAGVPAVREQGNRHGLPGPGPGLRRRHRPGRDPDLRHPEELLRLEHRVDLALAVRWPARPSPSSALPCWRASTRRSGPAAPRPTSCVMRMREDSAYRGKADFPNPVRPERSETKSKDANSPSRRIGLAGCILRVGALTRCHPLGWRCRPRLDPGSTGLRVVVSTGPLGPRRLQDRVVVLHRPPAHCRGARAPLSGSSSRSSGSACRRNRRGPAPPGAPNNVIMGHAALTDLDTGRHRFSELVVRAAPLLAGFGRHPDPAPGLERRPSGGTPDAVGAPVERPRLRLHHGRRREVLRLQPVHPPAQAGGVPGPRRPEPERGRRHRGQPLLQLHPHGDQRHGPRGRQRSGPSTGRAGWTRSSAPISSARTPRVGTGSALQLDDGREVMLYLLRSRNGGTRYAGATLVDPAGDGPLPETR